MLHRAKIPEVFYAAIAFAGFCHPAVRVDFAEEGTSGDFGRSQPGLEGRDGASLLRSAAGDGDFGAFTGFVGLGAFDQQFQAIVGPGHLRHVQPDEFRAA
jgi:hypothetical protein